MPYKPIPVDRENLSIMGVQFPDLETLNSAADAIGTNMFEGYEPTPRGIAIIRDYLWTRLRLTMSLSWQRRKNMPESYKYIDPDYTYTDPKTGVLRNLGNITGYNDLVFFEANAVSKRTKELKQNPMKNPAASTKLDPQIKM
jgi:hypothetical protein